MPVRGRNANRRRTENAVIVFLGTAVPGVSRICSTENIAVDVGRVNIDGSPCIVKQIVRADIIIAIAQIKAAVAINRLTVRRVSNIRAAAGKNGTISGICDLLVLEHLSVFIIEVDTIAASGS